MFATISRFFLLIFVNRIDLFTLCVHVDDCVCGGGFSGLPAAAIEPVPESSVSTVDERTHEERERWWKMGLKAISDGKLAVLLLSGGQVYLCDSFGSTILYIYYSFINDNNDVLFQYYWMLVTYLCELSLSHAMMPFDLNF